MISKVAIWLARGLVAAVLVAGMGPVWAGPIVDTGPVLIEDGRINSVQTRAGQFTLSSATLIDSFFHWMVITASGNMSFDIYTNDSTNNLPGAAIAGLTRTFAVTNANSPDWFGVTGLNWSLGAGTYWLVSSRAGSGGAFYNTPFCFPSTNPGCIASPLSSEARPADGVDPASGWLAVGGREGWRVNGRAVVPEPGSLALFAVALAGFAASRRRRAK